MVSSIMQALHLPDAPAGSTHRGLAVVEIFIILTIVLILALIVMPTFLDMTDTGRARSMATTARHMRELIGYKAAVHSVPLSAGGYPTTIYEAWFPTSQLPYHAWTNEPLKIETVIGGAHDIYPRVKTFNPDSQGAATAWYNCTNGAFCVRIPPQISAADTLATFNTVNCCNVTTLDQTTGH